MWSWGSLEKGEHIQLEMDQKRLYKDRFVFQNILWMMSKEKKKLNLSKNKN